MLHVELDVWNTYQFTFSILPSFVERCHVPRWNGDVPTRNNEDEGLDKGEIIQIAPAEEIATMEKSIVIATSVPIGFVPKPSSTGGSGGSGVMWKDGVLSSAGFRFIKGMEGFAPYPYQDSGGYWTICYGVTKHGEPTIYNELVSKAPVSEEEGAKVSYDLKNSNYAKPILQTFINFGCNNQNQFDALASFVYNIGETAFVKSTMLTLINQNSLTSAASQFDRWVFDNGKRIQGLVNRRAKEKSLFLRVV